MLGGIGAMEIAVILGVVILIFGPRQLPKLAKSFGETIRELRASSKAISEELDGTKKDLNETGRAIDREARGGR